MEIASPKSGGEISLTLQYVEPAPFDERVWGVAILDGFAMSPNSVEHRVGRDNELDFLRIWKVAETQV
jgi:hypothetical protein